MIPSPTGAKYNLHVNATSPVNPVRQNRFKPFVELRTRLNRQVSNTTSVTKDQNISKKSYGNMLKCCYFNARSINNKTNELHALLETYCYDLVFIVETWLTPNTQIAIICPRGYSIIRRDRQSKRGGGVLVLYRSHLPVLEVRNFEDDSIEYLCVDLVCNKKTPSRFLCCYIAPDFSRDKNCIEKLCKCIELLSNQNNLYISVILICRT